jgi:hypothetical protein
LFDVQDEPGEIRSPHPLRIGRPERILTMGEILRCAQDDTSPSRLSRPSRPSLPIKTSVD